MAEAAENAGASANSEESVEPKKKGGGKGLLIGLVGALLLGSASAYGVMSGLVPLGGAPEAELAEGAPGADGAGGAGDATAAKPAAETDAFLKLEPIVVGLSRAGGPNQLRLTLSIVTTDTRLGDVEAEQDRILDALNTLLRALDGDDLADSAGIDRLRAQMLRRIRVSTDPSAVRDLLITEYFLF
ncbi:MAG: flagellar basal body-associated FliL family protein [Pseudomonadota bacterium]